MAGVKFLNGINLVKVGQLFNALFHKNSGDPSSPVEAQVWYDTAAKKFRGRNDSASVTFVNDGGDLSAGSVANSKLTTDPLARGNHTGTQAGSTIIDLATVVQAYRLDQFAAPNTTVSMASHRLINVTDPSSAQDAATKNYVDGLIQGFSWKQPVRIKSTANMAVASAIVNGATVDGVTIATGDRILLNAQSAPAENGIYLVVATGAASRTNDADTAAELNNAAVFVSEGTVNADSAWVQTTNAPITLGTTAISFTQVGGGTGITGGDGLVLTGSTLDVVAGTGISVGANSVGVDTAVVVRKYSVLIGDNSATTITVTHGLGTDDLTFSVRDASTGEFVYCDVIIHTANTSIDFIFAAAPGTNAYKVVIHG